MKKLLSSCFGAPNSTIRSQQLKGKYLSTHPTPSMGPEALWKEGVVTMPQTGSGVGLDLDLWEKGSHACCSGPWSH